MWLRQCVCAISIAVASVTGLFGAQLSKSIIPTTTSPILLTSLGCGVLICLFGVYLKFTSQIENMSVLEETK